MPHKHKKLSRHETEPLISDSISYGSYLRSSSYSGNYNDASLPEGEEEIKKKLRWYFKNPYEKYKDRGRKPFKLILQVVKIIMVTVQATMFAVDEFSVVQFNMDNIETFRHLFLVDYNGDTFHELFTRQQVYEHMYHTWKQEKGTSQNADVQNQYYNFDHIMIGSYELMLKNKTHFSPMELCSHTNSRVRASYQERYGEKNTTVNNNNDGYFMLGTNGDEHTKHNCVFLKPPIRNSTGAFIGPDLETFINQNNITRNFEWLIDLKLLFSFTMNYTVVHKKNSPDCYRFDIEEKGTSQDVDVKNQVVFDNSDLDSIMTVELVSSVDFHTCRQDSQKLHIQETRRSKILWTVFDLCIITVCIISFTLCVRSFKRHYKLAKDTSKFFREYRHEKFTLSDQLNFLSFWLLLISLSDISSLAGSSIKILLDWMELPEIYNACSLCFGLAVLFSWIGILRYLGFMKGYNTLLVTLKTAFPTIIRFTTCVAFIYVGFTVCGWIVFGPYHTKFRDISVTSECLFALINGDDMFATFSGMDDSDALMWYFSKVYLYTFISLFIFVVLSLFIGIVADTYERIRDYGHPPKSRIELFMDGEEYHADGEHQHRHGGCNHHNVIENSDTENSIRDYSSNDETS